MPTAQPQYCEFILPSRFAAERPRTWHLVMDDAGRSLAARYGGDVPLRNLPDEAALRSRDRRMRDEASRRRMGLASGARNSGTLDTHKFPRADANLLSLQHRRREEGVRTAATSFLSGRIAAVQRNAPPRLQRTTPGDVIPREVPVSLSQ
ncbi:hypothetical protein TcYC6_0024640 [Trypanosoma cruzi]|nr:hypothetical protein TcYC6_0024640 [Trypanosoma cruzi]